MTRRFCPQCGAALEFSVQKFCTSCGASVPDVPSPPGRMAGTGPAGVPIWVFAIAAFLVLAIIAVVLLPHILQPGTSTSAGEAASGNARSLPSPSGTPLPGATTASPLSTYQTPVPTTALTTQSTPRPTTTVPTTTPTPSPAPTVSTPTPTPVPRTTTIITLTETQVPAQPPSSSYTSSNPAAPFVNPTALESRIHELINVQRQQNGLTTLSYDPFLADIARGHSWDMVTRNYFEHDDPSGKSPKDRGDAAGCPCIRVIGRYSYSGISENLYQGVRWNASYVNSQGATVIYDWKSLDDIAQQAVVGWMNSPGHRENVLREHYILEGIGVAFAPDDKVYVTQNFC